MKKAGKIISIVITVLFAAAVFAAARQNGECGKSAYVHHPGGELYIKEAGNGHILITGETRIVYEGEFSPGDVI